MKKLLFLIKISFAITLAASAQNNNTVKGQLIDSLNIQPLFNATVSIINAKDSSLIAFTRADSAGRFTFKKLAKGQYRLSASHVNFHNSWTTFQLLEASQILELPPIKMVDKTILQTVNITAQRAPVVVNGDTLEFNAEGFKTKPNAVVEDMLKKMPGVEVAKDGSVTVNGKKISRILVNGKDFFNGDPTIATRNLAADAVDKVQVFDKQSDQSAFTGIDDGNSQKTINLKLKKDKMNAAFGKASAAGGTDNRYESKFNLNKFKGEQQISSLGMANNINQQGFSPMDVMNFTGENKKMMRGGGGIMISTSGPQTGGVPISGLGNTPQGITTTLAGGLNYNNNWKKKTDLNTSYFYNNLSTDNQKNVYRKSLVQGNDFNYTESDNSNNSSVSNRVNLAMDQSIDSFNSIKLTSSLTLQSAGSNSKNLFSTLNANADSINAGKSLNSSNSSGYDVSNNLLLRHKFHKKGRTLSLNAVTAYNSSKLNSSVNSITNFYNNNIPSRQDTIDQTNNLRSITSSYGLNLTYTEPLSKKALVEFRSFYNSGDGTLNRNTYDINRSTGKYDQKNILLSNNYYNRYSTAGGGLSMRGLTKKITYSAGVNIEADDLRSHIIDSSFLVQHHTVNALPLANLTYNFSKLKTLRFDYNTSVTQPSSSQLQPVKDVSDPLNIRQGNPSLNSSYSHDLSLQFFSANPGKQSNLIAFANLSYLKNAIVNSDVISALGQRITTPINADGTYNIFGVVEKGFRVKQLSTRFNIGSNISYAHNINFINSQKELTNNLSYTPKLSADYSFKELLNISFATRWNFNDVHYSVEKQLNNKYLKQLYNIDGTLTFSNGLTFTTDLAYTVNKGRTDGYNKNTSMWNAAIAKQIFKSKKGEIKFSVYNLLNQNIGIDRNANANYVEDVSYNTLRRYATLGFTYSLQKPGNGGPKMVMRSF